MDVMMPDGTTVQGVPDGVTQSQLMARYSKFQAAQTVSQPKGGDLSTGTGGPQAPGITRTALDQGLQGATFGLGDKITDVIGSGIASAYTGNNFFDTLNDARNQTKQDMSLEMQQHPIVSIGSQLAGGLLTGNAISDAAEGTSIANLLRRNQVAQGASLARKTGNIALNMGKSGLVGAATGAAYGAGSAEDAGQIIPGAKTEAEFGGAIGAAVPAVAGAVGALENRVFPESQNALVGVNADQKFINAVEPVKNNYQNVLSKENNLWGQARDSANGADISGGAIQGLPSKIEDSLNDQIGKSLSDDDLKPLAAQIAKFKSFKGQSISADASGDLPVVTPSTDAPLSDVIALRKGVSSIAGNNPDGTVRKAAGVALSQIDDHLGQIGADAIKGGDPDALQKFQDAVTYSRQKFTDFGTNSKTGQNPIFEKVITKDDFDNSQIVKAFGATTRGNQGTSQLISRLLDNAGNAREDVRSNIAQGYIARAIEKSTTNLEGGETGVNPNRLRVELSRLISGSTSDGGMGDDLRNTVFQPNEIKSITNLRDNIKDAKNWMGMVRAVGVKIPLADAVITKPQIAASRNTAKQVNNFISSQAIGAQKSLAGTPKNYSAIVSKGTSPAIAATALSNRK